MAASKAAEMVDPTVSEQYPVVLSDALLGKASKDVFTGIRYNHKPALSSDAAPSTARLKPSPAGAGEFDLSYVDNGGRYAYAGARAPSTAAAGAKDQPYVLVFDPARRAFVLHRVDSLFAMNLTRTPTTSDPDSLRAAHPHLPRPPPAPSAAGKSARDGKAAGASAKSGGGGGGDAVKKEKKADAPAPLPLLPPPPAVEPKAAAETTAAEKRRRRRQQEEESESDDDGDGGLVIEFPEGRAPPSARRNDFSPAFPTPAVHMRRFSEFAAADAGAEEDEDGVDADAEADDDAPFDPGWDPDDEEDDGEPGMDGFKLPSPVNNPVAPVMAAPVEDYDDAKLLEEFMDSDSSVSEED